MINNNRARINQSILIIAVLTLAIVVFWAFLGINRALSKTEKPVVSEKEITPIKSGLDVETIKLFREKK